MLVTASGPPAPQAIVDRQIQALVRDMTTNRAARHSSARASAEPLTAEGSERVYTSRAGNPAGRCTVIYTLLRDFSKHGEKAIAKVRQTQPASLLENLLSTGASGVTLGLPGRPRAYVPTPALAAGSQSVILLAKRPGRLLDATGARLKEFDSILVAPERRSPEYLQREMGHGDQSRKHQG